MSVDNVINSCEEADITVNKMDDSDFVELLREKPNDISMFSSTDALRAARNLGILQPGLLCDQILSSKDEGILHKSIREFLPQTTATKNL